MAAACVRSASTRPTCRKPARKKTRAATVLYRLDDGSFIVEVAETGPRSDHADQYRVSPLDSDFGRAFLWQGMGKKAGSCYECNTGGQGEPACCCCKGFERFGYCRHVAESRNLLAAGQLDAPHAAPCNHADVARRDDGYIVCCECGSELA